MKIIMCTTLSIVQVIISCVIRSVERIMFDTLVGDKIVVRIFLICKKRVPISDLIRMKRTFIITFSFLPVLSNLVDKEVLNTYMNIILSYNQILFLIIPFFYCYKKGFNVKEIFRINPVNNRILLFSVVLSISLFIITD